MFDVCYLHIGLEKTGSTSIQQFLHTNRDVLASRGFYHPHSLGTPNNTSLYLYGAEEDRINDAHRVVRRGLSPADFRLKVERDLRTELAGRSGTLILSNEHLHSEVRTPGGIARIRDLIAPHAREVKVVAYLRRQDRVAVSQYSTAMKSGLQTLPDVFRELDENTEYYFCYDMVLENYAAVFGADNVIAKIFERDLLTDGDAVLDFAACIGLRDFSWLQKSVIVNESLRPIALRFLAEANKRIPLLMNDTAHPLRLKLVAAIEQHYAGAGPSASQEQARSFYALFRESNERVRQRWFPARPNLFSEDFTMYPEQAAPDEFTFEDAARVGSILLSSLVN